MKLLQDILYLAEDTKPEHVRRQEKIDDQESEELYHAENDLKNAEKELKTLGKNVTGKQKDRREMLLRNVKVYQNKIARLS